MDKCHAKVPHRMKDFTFFLKDIQVEILSQLLWSQKVTNIMRNNSLGIVNIQSVFNASLLFVDKSLTEGPNDCWWHLQARLQAEQEKNMMDWHKQEHRKWETGRNDEGKGVGAGSISSVSLPVLHCGKKREKPIYIFSVCQVESFCILHGLIPTDL